MYYIGRLWSNISGYYSDINRANLTGAIDVIVVEQEDGSLKSTPFHVRFGKTDVLRPKDNLIDIYVNGELIPDLEITLGPSGEGYFVEKNPSKESSPAKDVTTNQYGSDKESPSEACRMDTDVMFQMDDDADKTEEPPFIPVPLPPRAPPSPPERTSGYCKSDGELETEDDPLNWDWGKLPEDQRRRKSISKRNSLTRKTDASKENQPTKAKDGIYLSDIHNTIEKKLYLYNYLPSTDPSKEIYHHAKNIGGNMKTIRSLPFDTASDTTEFQLSLCGGLQSPDSISFDKFLERLITFEDFQADPTSILNHPDLVVRWEGHFYSWQIVAPLLVSFLVFQKPLPDEVLHKLAPPQLPPQPYQSKRAIVRSWFSWGRNALPPDGSVAAVDTGDKLTTPTKEVKNTLEVEGDPNHLSVAGFTSLASSPMDRVLPQLGTSLPDRPPELPWSSQEGKESPGSLRNTGSRTGTLDEGMGCSLDTWEDVCHSDGDLDLHSSGTPSTPTPGSLKGHSRIKRTIVPTSDQLKRLNLRPGANSIVYSIVTQFQGTCKCSCYIYLWKSTDKLVISDIDGTITKSDVLGHIFPLVGKDWTQSGIVRVYNRIQENQYRFIYLSARAIGQAGFTRAFLQSVVQDNLRLPDGAVLLSPSSLLVAFKKEVIERHPEEFKIACLKDLASLFPPDAFHAGFGNKATDVATYTTLGINPSRIFTVNRRGQLHNEVQETNEMATSYSSLSLVVDQYFPPLTSSPAHRNDIVGAVINESGENSGDAGGISMALSTGRGSNGKNSPSSGTLKSDTLDMGEEKVQFKI